LFIKETLQKTWINLKHHQLQQQAWAQPAKPVEAQVVKTET